MSFYRYAPLPYIKRIFKEMRKRCPAAKSLQKMKGRQKFVIDVMTLIHHMSLEDYTEILDTYFKDGPAQEWDAFRDKAADVVDYYQNIKMVKAGTTSNRSRSSSPVRAPPRRGRLRLQKYMGVQRNRVAQLPQNTSIMFVTPADESDTDRNFPGNICKGVRQVCRYRDPKTKRYTHFPDDGSEEDEYEMKIEYT